MQKIEAQLNKLISLAEKDQDILAIIIYGSYARGEKYRLWRQSKGWKITPF